MWARIGSGKSDQNFVRPHRHSSECGGRGAEVEGEVQAASEKAILSLEDEMPAEAEVNRDEIVAVDEE